MECSYCNQEKMKPTTRTCHGNREIKFADDSLQPSVQFMSMDKSRCPGCNVISEGFHHPGCYNEICPRCRDGLSSCYCSLA